MTHPNAKFDAAGKRVCCRDNIDGITFEAFSNEFPVLALGIIQHVRDLTPVADPFNVAEEFRFISVRIHEKCGIIETYDRVYNGGEFFYDMKTLEYLGHQGNLRGTITLY